MVDVIEESRMKEFGRFEERVRVLTTICGGFSGYKAPFEIFNRYRDRDHSERRKLVMCQIASLLDTSWLKSEVAVTINLTVQGISALIVTSTPENNVDW